jgi:transposase
VARYSNDFRERAVARLLPPESAEITRLSQEIGVSVATLERWMADALSRPAAQRAWTAAARLEAVIATASMDEAQRSAWSREQGLFPADLQQWRQSATAALSQPEEARASPQETRDDRRRIKELERDLRRKEKALAETAALLVLSKNVWSAPFAQVFLPVTHKPFCVNVFDLFMGGRKRHPGLDGIRTHRAS